MIVGIKNLDGEIIGFISGLIIELSIESKIVKTTEVNFLCVKKEFRKKMVAILLIQEIV